MRCIRAKSEQMYFGMKADIGADTESGLVHTVVGSSGNVHDITQDYITHCTHDDAKIGKRMLSFDRAIETAFYNTLPHNLDC